MKTYTTIIIFLLVLMSAGCAPPNITPKPDNTEWVEIIDQEYFGCEQEPTYAYSSPSEDSEILWELQKGFPLRVLKLNFQWAFVEDFEKEKFWVKTMSISKTKTVVVKSEKVYLYQINDFNEEDIDAINSLEQLLLEKNRTTFVAAKYGVVFKVLKIFNDSAIVTVFGGDDKSFYIVEDYYVWPHLINAISLTDFVKDKFPKNFPKIYCSNPAIDKCLGVSKDKCLADVKSYSSDCFNMAFNKIGENITNENIDKLSASYILCLSSFFLPEHMLPLENDDKEVFDHFQQCWESYSDIDEGNFSTLFQ